MLAWSNRSAVWSVEIKFVQIVDISADQVEYFYMSKPKNPNRTGGPRTVSGKMVASSNSLKTGVYSRQVVLPGESESDFLELQRLFMSDLQPQGSVELLLVHELAVLAWKKMRLQGLEQSVFSERLASMETPQELMDAGFPRVEGIEKALQEIGLLTADYMAQRKRDLVLALSLREKDALKEVMREVRVANPDFYARLLGFKNDSKNENAMVIHVYNALPDSEDFPASKFDDSGIRDALDGMAAHVRALIHVYEHLPLIQTLRPVIRSRRLSFLMDTVAPRRVFDDLSRAFFKTLEELRKQQKWRK